MANVSVTWRLPGSVVDEMEGDFSPLREKLDKWAKKAKALDPPPRDEKINRCLMVDAAVLAKLEKEAKRLTKKHGRRFTAATVAALVWDQTG